MCDRESFDKSVTLLAVYQFVQKIPDWRNDPFGINAEAICMLGALNNTIAEGGKVPIFGQDLDGEATTDDAEVKTDGGLAAAMNVPDLCRQIENQQRVLLMTAAQADPAGIDPLSISLIGLVMQVLLGWLRG